MVGVQVLLYVQSRSISSESVEFSKSYGSIFPEKPNKAEPPNVRFIAVFSAKNRRKKNRVEVPHARRRDLLKKRCEKNNRYPTIEYSFNRTK